MKGTTTSQQGTVRLPGVAVSLLDLSGGTVATTQSDGDGNFSFQGIAPGRYSVVAKLDGFRDAARPIEVQQGGGAVEASLDLDVAVSETVSVVAKATDTNLTIASTMASRTVVATPLAEQLPVNGDSIQAALRLMSSVSEQTGGVRIKGGRPDQASLQLGNVIVNDPTGGAGALRLPVDAAETVAVLPNPYSVEFGGFSSGLTLVDPRSGGDQWRFQANGLDPSLITKRDNPFYPIALAAFDPRIVVGGPIVKDKVYLLQSAQYRYNSLEVWSRPQSQRQDSEGVSWFTRLDGKAGTSHTYNVTFGYFPNDSLSSDLDTFTPPAATIDVREQAAVAAFTDSAQISSRSVFDSTIAVSHFSTLASGQGIAPMVMSPEQVHGNFFNTQDRSATTAQLSEVLSVGRTGLLGTHLFKAGVTLLYTDYAATSTSRPIEVRRSDGTLAERLAFDPSTTQATASADIAGFVQDRWQPSSRLLVEFGGRLERDGVLQTVNFSPRAGGTLALKADGSIALHAGIGVFTERTPAAVAAFGELGTQVESRYAADGVTLIGPPVVYAHALAADLRTPQSLTWNVEYDHKVTPQLSFRVNYLSRTGSNELTVDPIVDGTTGVLQLGTNGRSVYHDAEVGVHYIRENVVEVTASYTRSLSMANLNAYSAYFGLKQDPFVRPDAYAPTDVNAPNRLLAWVTVSAVPQWLFGVVADVHNGYPWSPVDQYLDFVGPRNVGQTFPTYVGLDLSVERRITLGKLRPWLGFRIYNSLNSFVPADVQANVGSPAFGTFYNSMPLQFRISFRFGR